MSLMKELHSEITRLARKEIKKELEPIKRVNAAQRGYIADLRRDVGELQKEVARLQKDAGKVVVVETEETTGFWISGKGVLSLRKRLGITQMELAALAKVSHQSIVRWEKAEGKISFKTEETLATMQQIRSMGKREAWETLGKEK
ncbi:MAG: helix-turn-helix transcriptional regulator [Verrucomicrobia bacterium]|nr:helix-turn-helix transcriptional regulator [Verrucomicrobiota bacterium]